MAWVTAVRSDFKPHAIIRSRSESLVTIGRVYMPDLVVRSNVSWLCCSMPLRICSLAALALSAVLVGSLLPADLGVESTKTSLPAASGEGLAVADGEVPPERTRP